MQTISAFAPAQADTQPDAATVPQVHVQADEMDLYDLDISIVESGPVIPELLRSTSDNCGGTCGSACTSCRS